MWRAEFHELAKVKEAAAVAAEADKSKLERELDALKKTMDEIRAEIDKAVGVLHEVRKLLGLAGDEPSA